MFPNGITTLEPDQFNARDFIMIVSQSMSI